MRTRAVTFDCWSTLLYERDTAASYARRVEALARVARERGAETPLPAARAALDHAWRRHWALWHEGVASGSPEMAAWALEVLLPEGTPDLADSVDQLSSELAEAALDAEILVLEGAVTTLERLADAGIRRALICDTGFSPGVVVRRMLERVGLLELLEVTVFSDEAGVPKPHPRLFQTALATLGLEHQPDATVHVGDLRRTDVAGARTAGMRSVRIRGHHDDLSELPEADHVADSHAHLQEILLLG